ncbi:MAG: hypothetical protein ACTSUD_06350 [Alphaproteobacteria bacterium]
MRMLIVGGLLLASPGLAVSAETFPWKVDCICQSGAGTGQILGHVRVTKANFDWIKKTLLAGGGKQGAKVTLLGKNCGDLKMCGKSYADPKNPKQNTPIAGPKTVLVTAVGGMPTRGFDLLIERLRVGNNLMIGGKETK